MDGTVMRYTQLKAFYNVARHSGFSRAAKYLNQSQPSLSDHVRQLERDHDMLLFDRTNRQVVLTAAGEELFHLVQHFFDAEEVIAEFLDRSRKTVKGRLRIIADSPAHITSLLKQFGIDHPDIAIDLRTGNSAKVLQTLRNYEAEIGIFVAGTAERDLFTKPLGAAPIVALSAPEFLRQHGVQRRADGMLNFADLARLPLIFREAGSQTQSRVLRAARDRGITLTSSFVVEGRETMRDLVAEGFGIGFASAVEIGADSQLEKILIAQDGLDMPETLACLASRQNVPVIKAFLASLDAWSKVST